MTSCFLLASMISRNSDTSCGRNPRLRITLTGASRTFAVLHVFIDMHMGGFVRLIYKNHEPKSALSQDRWHCEPEYLLGHIPQTYFRILFDLCASQISSWFDLGVCEILSLRPVGPVFGTFEVDTGLKDAEAVIICEGKDDECVVWMNAGIYELKNGTLGDAGNSNVTWNSSDGTHGSGLIVAELPPPFGNASPFCP